MNFKNTQLVNATLLAQAVQLEQHALFLKAESEKAEGVAKQLRELAKVEGQSSDPKVEPIKASDLLPTTMKLTPAEGAVFTGRTTRPTVEESRQIAGSDQSFDRIAHNG